MLSLAFLVLLPRALLGFIVAHAIWRSTDSKDLLIKAALGGPLGWGVSSLLGFFWIWAGLDVRAYALLETGVIALLAAFAAWRYWGNLAAALRRLRLRFPARDLFWPAILVLAFLIFSAEFWSQLLPSPHGRWDAWSNWNVVARFMYRGGEHWTGTFLRKYDHPDYPLLLAISNAISWALLPRETTRGPMAFAFFNALSLIGLMFVFIHKLRDRAQASLAAVLMMTQPFVAYYSVMLFADLPLAVYFLAALGLAVLFLSQPDPGIAVLAGLAAGLAGWTKNEGLPFIITFALGWMWIARSKPGGRPIFGRFLAGLALPLLTIACFKIFLAPPNDLLSGGQDVASLMLDPARYVFILRRSFQLLWGDGSLIVILLLAIYALIVGRTSAPGRGTALLPAILLAQAAIYFLTYLTSPHDLEWHIRTSVGRLYLHIFPGLLLAAFLWLRPPAELRSPQLQAEHAAHH